MSAKDMFEKLNYDYSESIDEERFSAYISIDRNSEIIFDNNDKTFRKQFLNSAVVKKIDLEELQAINKQVEELGWLEEVEDVNITN